MSGKPTLVAPLAAAHTFNVGPDVVAPESAQRRTIFTSRCRTECHVNEAETNQMKNSMMKTQRRDFLKIGSLAAASIAIAARVGRPARAAEPHVDEKDATAQSLGYKHDATKVDKAKFAKYKAGEACANCQLYQGKPGGAWGPCPIFGGKEVSAKGWCSAYVKKA